MSFIINVFFFIKKLIVIKNSEKKYTILIICNEKLLSTNNLVKINFSLSKIKSIYNIMGKPHYENLSLKVCALFD